MQESKRVIFVTRQGYFSSVCTPLSFLCRSFAYLTVKDRMPTILTKVIDTLHRNKDKFLEEYGKVGFARTICRLSHVTWSYMGDHGSCRHILKVFDVRHAGATQSLYIIAVILSLKTFLKMPVHRGQKGKKRLAQEILNNDYG